MGLDLAGGGGEVVVVVRRWCVWWLSPPGAADAVRLEKRSTEWRARRVRGGGGGRRGEGREEGGRQGAPIPQAQSRHWRAGRQAGERGRLSFG